MVPPTISSIIDHTLLNAEATRAEIEKLCEEGREFGFASVCVYGSWVELCAALLSGSGVRVTSVAGFPHGASTTSAKAAEMKDLVALGVDEIDVVAPIGRMREGNWQYVEDEFAAVLSAAEGRVVKVILETAALDEHQIGEASRLAAAAGASFVKTSTGFHTAGGASVAAVTAMKIAVGTRLGIKAAGGIRTLDDALRMIEAGATRIGTSSGVEIAEAAGGTPLEELITHRSS